MGAESLKKEMPHWPGHQDCLGGIDGNSVFWPDSSGAIPLSDPLPSSLPPAPLLWEEADEGLWGSDADVGGNMDLIQ